MKPIDVRHIKNEVMRSFFLIAARLVRGLRGARRRAPRSVLVVPPVMYAGSRGDEAMLQALIGTLKSERDARIALVTASPPADWGVAGDVEAERVRSAGLGVEFLDASLWKFSWLVRKYDECLILGADVLDGGHGDWGHHGLIMADIAVRAGLETTILGCSVNEAPSERARSWWRRLHRKVRVCARDPQSATRLRCLMGREPVLVADLAFLLAPRNDTALVKAYYDWKREQDVDQAQAGVIAFNLSAHFFKSLRAVNKERFSIIANYVEYMAEVIKRLTVSLPHVSFVLVSHDTRGKISDTDLNRKLIETLQPGIAGKVFVVPEAASSSEIKAIVSQVSMVVTARMHLAIASLGQTTPCLGFAYQGKFEGLFHSVGVFDSVLSAEEIAKMPSENMAAKIAELTQEAHKTSESIATRLPEIVGRARKNLRWAI